jgi:hypothetical protein
MTMNKLKINLESYYYFFDSLKLIGAIVAEIMKFSPIPSILTALHGFYFSNPPVDKIAYSFLL